MEGDQCIRHILPASHPLHVGRGSTLPARAILPEESEDIQMVLESIACRGLHLHFYPWLVDYILLKMAFLILASR